MSGKLMGEIYNLELPRGERDVLLALADNANDDGGDCFPGIDLIAWKLDCSIRKVQYCLRALELKGAILVIGNQNGGRGKRPEYQINLSGLPLKKGAKTSNKGCKNEPIKGVKSDIGETERVQKPAQKGANLNIKGAIPDIKGAKTSIAYKEEPPIEPPEETPGETPSALEAVASVTPPPLSGTPTTRLIVRYHEMFVGRFGKKPNIHGGKDGSLLKALVAKYGEEEVGNLLADFFDSPDEFIRNSGYTIGAFNSQINKLLVKPARLPTSYLSPIGQQNAIVSQQFIERKFGNGRT